MRRSGTRRLERVHSVVTSSSEMRCDGTVTRTRRGRVIEEKRPETVAHAMLNSAIAVPVLQELRRALWW